MKIIVFMLYGDAAHYQPELTYSVLSFLRYLRDDPADIRLLYVCDEANRRPDLPMEELVVSSETLRDWSFGGTYNHAVKVHALRHVLQTYDAPAVLMDCDTYATAHPRELFNRIGPGRALLNCSEGPLSGLHDQAAQFEAIISRSGGSIRGFPVSWDTEMFNSGVKGFHPRDLPTLDKAVEVIRDIRGMVELFTANQLAYGMVLPALMQVGGCEDIIAHYWGGPRQWYRYQIARFFPWAGKPGAVAVIPQEMPVLLEMPPYGPGIRFKARVLRSLRGGDGTYAHAWLCSRQALGTRADPPLANSWAEMALNTLRYGKPPVHRRERVDFAEFTAPAIDRLTWMQPGQRKGWLALWDSRPLP